MLDVVDIYAKGGNGGNGAVSFRREKFVPRGGPDGGNGGNGGSVILETDQNLSTLSQFRHRRHFKAEPGVPGKDKDKHGRNGEEYVVKVPLGTIVYSMPDPKDAGETPEIVADLSQSGQRAALVAGGRGGRGNATYKSSVRQAPDFAQKGMLGEEGWFRLELKLIADVGLVGLPNAGKSSLLAAISAARPKIASYPFTTLEPNLGVVDVGYDSFVVADIPGLIEGAHEGAGLGLDFLRHIQRTKVLVHLIDGSSPDPVDDMKRVNIELTLYDEELVKKPHLVVVNKFDLEEVRGRRSQLAELFADEGIKVKFISALGREGLDELVNNMLEMVQRMKADATAPTGGFHVFRPRPVDQDIAVSQDGDRYIVSGARVERLLTTISNDDPRSMSRLRQNLRRMGLDKLLEGANAEEGAKIVAGAFEFEWQ
ncbi:MAG: GTPase ObgE [Dehalococcoidia bacterium]|nr:GTPase ObgE [Dehalococcoidia bacterium]